MDSNMICQSKDVRAPSTVSSETNSEISPSSPFPPSPSTGTSSCQEQSQSQSHEYLSGVPLHYEIVHRSHDHMIPPGIKNVPCVLLPGFLGSGSSMKLLSQSLPFKTYILPDLRNHGKSPRSTTMAFDVMAQDLVMLLDKLNIEEAAIIGHSLGGRVAMATALFAPMRVAYLGALDVVPVYTEEEINGTVEQPRSGGLALIELLNAVPLSQLSNRKEVALWLAENHKGSKPLPAGLVQYLLQDLTTVDKSIDAVTDDPNEGISPSLRANSSSRLCWASHLPNMLKCFMREHFHWPFNATQNFTRGPVVFVKALKSDFVRDCHLSTIKMFFPKADIRVIDRTHLLHYEAPDEVAAQLIDGWRSSASS